MSDGTNRVASVSIQESRRSTNSGVALNPMRSTESASAPSKCGHLLVECLVVGHFVEKRARDLGEVGFGDSLLTQLWKDVGDVVPEDSVGGQDHDIVRAQGVFEAVEQKRYAVQRDGRLTRTSHSLENEYPRRFVANHRILLALNGRDDVLHSVVGRLAQLALQNIVADVQRTVEHELQGPVLDLVLTLGGDVTVDPAARRLDKRRPRLEVVVEAGNRRAPIVYAYLMGFGVEEVVDSDVELGTPIIVALAEVDAAEVRRIEQLFRLVRE